MDENETRSDIIMLCKVINNLLDDMNDICALENKEAEQFLVDMQKKYKFNVNKE